MKFAPGSYSAAQLSIEQYHGQCTDRPSVSASVLHKMISECPAIVWETSSLNPNRVEEESSTALDFGQAVHALVLGEPEFNSRFVIAPFDSFRTKEAREWRDAETRTVLKAEAFEQVKAMVAAQRRSPQVARAFENGKPEVSLIWTDKETGIDLKSRPDWLPDDPAMGFIVDFKSARSIHPRKLSAAVFDYGYHLQSAVQCDGVKEVLGASALGCAHVVQEKSAPYLAELKMFTPEQTEFGRREYRRALRIFAKCWEAHLAGKPERVAWPGFTVDAQYYETPYYIQKLMENDADGIANLGNKYGYTASDYFAAG